MVRIKRGTPLGHLANIPSEIRIWVHKRFILSCLKADDIPKFKTRQLYRIKEMLEKKDNQLKNIKSIVERAILKHKVND
jgi:hypothetical protein